MTIEKALDNFITDRIKFEAAVNVATNLNFEPMVYVELFPNSTFRIVRQDELDYDYETPGLILEIPELNSMGSYEAAMDQLRNDFYEA